MMCYVQTSSGASSSQMAEMNRGDGDELCKCSSNVSGMGYTKNSVLVTLCVCVLCACMMCVCV